MGSSSPAKNGPGTIILFHYVVSRAQVWRDIARRFVIRAGLGVFPQAALLGHNMVGTVLVGLARVDVAAVSCPDAPPTRGCGEGIRVDVRLDVP